LANSRRDQKHLGIDSNVLVAYLVPEHPEHGVVKWLANKVHAVNETLPMSQSWIPRAKGMYTVEVFLWDTIENSVPLADVMKAEIVVS